VISSVAVALSLAHDLHVCRPEGTILEVPFWAPVARLKLLLTFERASDTVCPTKYLALQGPEMTHTDLENLENEAYRDSFSDGLVDLFVGLGLALIGVLWLWFPAVAGLAGVLAAAVAWALVPIRRRIVEPRVGHVKWTTPRLKWERKQFWLLFGLGSVALILGVGLVLSIVRGDVATSGDPNVVAALPAVLFAIGAFVLAATSGIKRLWGYGAVLVIAAAATIVVEAGPGGSLLVAGAVIGVGGVVLLSRFLRAHPVRGKK